MKPYDKNHPHNAVFCEQLQSVIDGNPKAVQYRVAACWDDLTMLENGTTHADWMPHIVYRIKPPEPVMVTRTVTYPAPMTVAPEIGTECFSCLPGGVAALRWLNDYVDKKWLVAGVCHFTREAAQQQWDALFGVQK